jgi:photosynthetic reaction center H subunit
MPTGAITGYIDVAQIALYVFWFFFAALIYYLLQENKREGYPLESERSAHITVQGWPPIPSPKTFKLHDGTIVSAPNKFKSPQTLNAKPTGNWLGAPIEPTGNPLLAGVGPGAYADRADTPDINVDGTPRIPCDRPLISAWPRKTPILVACPLWGQTETLAGP